MDEEAMNNNLVSIILPVYNAERYLSKAIESILNQTFGNFEFIIINDGSTDSSLNIIETYRNKDSRIKLISRENKGLVFSLNEGIDLAQGKYIARMDADDISMPERLEKQVQYLNDHSNISVVGTFIHAFGDNSDEVEKTNVWFNETIDGSNALIKTSRGCPLCHPSVMMRKEFLQKERYSPIYNYMEDYEMWIRAIKKGYQISNMDQILLKYRLHADSKSYTEKRKAMFQRISCRLENFYYPTKRNVLVWGAGLGGQVFTEYIQSSEWGTKINILAIVDKNKEGFLNGIKIIKPTEIDKFKYEFIFITSELGYHEISLSLNEKGLELFEDYIYGA